MVDLLPEVCKKRTESLLMLVILYPFRLRDNLLELKIYYESLTYSDVKQVPSYDLYSLLGKFKVL